MMKTFLFCVCSIVSLLMPAGAQTVRSVPGAYATIADAVTASAPGDIISIGAGTYAEQLRITKNLTFIGAGEDLTIVKEAAGVPDSTAFVIDNATVTVRDLQFLGGAGTDGGRRGLVALNSVTTIRRCAFVAFFNVSIADVNGSLDIDSVVITSVNSGGAVVTDSAGAGQFANVADLGVMLVNSQFSIRHLTAGAFIDHVIDLHPDLHSNSIILGQDYPVDTTIFPQGVIEDCTIFGSRDGDWGQGIRINGTLTRHQAELVIRNNRFRGTAIDSTGAMPNRVMTAGIGFNGWNGYAEIYNNTITQFNSGISFHGIATASVHNNVITGNARYGIVTTDGVYAFSPPDLGGGAFASPGANTIMNNGQYNVFNQNNAVLWAQGNYWGATDPAAIDAKFYDDNENLSLGAVQFDNFLLPVELTTFTASRLRSGQVALEWTTATEINCAGFFVERSAAGSANLHQWTTLGFIQGAGTSAARHVYRYIDTEGEDLLGASWSYRLKQIDRDGRVEYSQTRRIESLPLPPHTCVLSQNYPNPFNPSTRMTFIVASKGHAALKIYDVLGRCAVTLFDQEAEPGVRYEATFDASAFSGGVYFARLESNGVSVLRTLTLIK
ncbi:MAG TPA: DUF1565 domain-containing protein [Bacteroidota bacterium]|nr:DUF1565 domain-containing protein [Bacteroidota bacterium]